MRHLQCILAGKGLVSIGDDNGHAAQFRHVGKRIADHHSRAQHQLAGELQILRIADDVPITPRLGDQLRPAHQGRHHHFGHYGLHALLQDFQQQAGGAFAGVHEVLVGVGVVDCSAIAVAQHAVRQHAVQIQGDHDGLARPQNLARLLQQIPFWVQLLLGTHRAMQGEVQRIAVTRVRLHLGQQLSRDALESRLGERARAARLGAVSWNDLHAAMGAKDVERTPDAGFHALVGRNQSGPMVNFKVGVLAQHGIKAGNLLLALCY